MLSASIAVGVNGNTNGSATVQNLALQNGESIDVTAGRGGAAGSAQLMYSYVDFPINSSHTFVRQIVTSTAVDIIPSSSVAGQFRRVIAPFFRVGSTSPTFRPFFTAYNNDTINHVLLSFYGTDLATRPSVMNANAATTTFSSAGLIASSHITTKAHRMALQENHVARGMLVCALYETIG